MRYFCSSAIFGYLGGQMGNKMGDNQKVKKRNVKKEKRVSNNTFFKS
jgi:hypothetical protein